MKLKIFITALVFLFSVKLASAQISIPADRAGFTTYANPNFEIKYSGETATKYVIHAEIKYSPPYSVSGSIASVGGSALSQYGAGDTPFQGSVSLYGDYYGVAILPIETWIYETSSDTITVETFYTAVYCNY